MVTIKHNSDLVKTVTSGCILHIVNNDYMFGSGFAKALMDRYPEARTTYMSIPKLVLGRAHMFSLTKSLDVAHLVAQVSPKLPQPRIRYAALSQSLIEITGKLTPYTEIHLPKIGAGLAGGNWEVILPIIENELGSYFKSVTIHLL